MFSQNSSTKYAEKHQQNPVMLLQTLNFSDIQQMVLAFQANPYPYSDPADCP